MAAESPSSGIRQAAILVASVDSTTARQLLQQMPAAMAKAVRKAMVELGRIDPGEQKAVLAAFESNVRRKPSAPTPAASPVSSSNRSVGTAREVSSPVVGNGIMPGTVTSSLAMGQPPVSSRDNLVGAPLAGETSLWDKSSPEQILECVQAERPTVIAVVLTQLQPGVANQVLAKLGTELRTEVLIQLSKLQQVDTEIMQDITEQLQQRLALTRPVTAIDNSLSLNRLKSILEAGGEERKIELCRVLKDATDLDGSLKRWVEEQAVRKDSGKAVAEVNTDPVEIGTQDSKSPSEDDSRKVTIPLAANETKQAKQSKYDSYRAFEFEDLKWIGLNQLAQVLQNCEPRALLVALSTADKELLNRISQLFSKSDWKRLKERLQSLGRIDVDDIHAARMNVAETAESLLNEKDLQQFVESSRHSYARAA